MKTRTGTKLFQQKLKQSKRIFEAIGIKPDLKVVVLEYAPQAAQPVLGNTTKKTLTSTSNIATTRKSSTKKNNNTGSRKK
jgi:hypothetical protein